MKNFKKHFISAFHTFVTSFLVMFFTLVLGELDAGAENIFDIFSFSSIISTVFVALRATLKEVLPIFISSLKDGQ